jgi:hypothetical protein
LKASALLRCTPNVIGRGVLSAGLTISGARQEVIGVKEVGLVEYRFQPDSFEVRHVRAPSQIDVDLDSLRATIPSSY